MSKRRTSRSWEMLLNLIRWVLRGENVWETVRTLLQCWRPPTGSDCNVCPNSALHRQQWRRARWSFMSWFAPLRKTALTWHGWSEIRKGLWWVKLKDSWSDWSRRLLIWGGKTLSWNNLNTQMITSISCRSSALWYRTFCLILLAV